jgi:hypothetical protein
MVVTTWTFFGAQRDVHALSAAGTGPVHRSVIGTVRVAAWNLICTLRKAGEKVHHVFLDLPADVLEARIRAQVVCPGDLERDESNRQFRLNNIARCVAAAKEQPDDTVMLRSDLMDPAQLADAVLTAVGE